MADYPKDDATMEFRFSYPGPEECLRQVQHAAENASCDRGEYCYPECENSLVPMVDQTFATLEEGIKFYKINTTAAGFDARRSSEKKNKPGEITKKLMVCSRERFNGSGREKQKNSQDLCVEATTPVRNRTTNRVGCMAKLILRRTEDGTYEVSSFEPRHNHALVSTMAHPFMRANRRMETGLQLFMATCAKANIGPSKAFKLYKEMVGGSANVGATCVDFHNFKRDIVAYMSSADAQLVVNKYLKKHALCPTFVFEHHVDDERRLCRVFWADTVARKNFAIFGDTMSLDATYGTNKYNLVFVPFTGVDNHKRCVTFAVGLIAKEDVDSYSWLLQKFKDTMGREPSCTITDQDPSMKIAIAQVFPMTRHRFCMWHIMTKVGEKVGAELAKNETFRKALNDIVWNDGLGVGEFEIRWHAVMEEYGLANHKWFKVIFDMRAQWILAFFNDLFMGGLLRTTSRSEAENSAFGSCISHNSSLVEFFVRFEGAMDTQRHEQAKCNAACEGRKPALRTPLKIEQQLASVYTVTIFYDVQQEIIAGCFTCRVSSRTIANGLCIYTIGDLGGKSYTVQLNADASNVMCTCGMFNRVGLLCRHIFLAFKESCIDHIPNGYINPRWTRGAGQLLPHKMVGVWCDVSAGLEQDRKYTSELWNEFYACLSQAGGHSEHLRGYAQVLREKRKRVCQVEGTSSHVHNKEDVITAFCGTPTATAITIRPPGISTNKGSGKRLKSAKERGMERAFKANHLCRTCHKHASHDSRNCPESK